jgi:hypothetical protein|tara:strand:- start:375 stop:1076 length:702 start_codon:yes stop_codon:yes gene_type:complete
MGRISNFVLDTSVESSDKLLGSNSGGATKNFAILDISTFLKNTNAAGASGQIVYSFESNVGHKTNGSFVGTFSSGTQFSKLTSIKVSKFPNGSSNTVANYLSTLVDKNIILGDVSNINNFGTYFVNSVTQDSNATDYYDISLTAISGNGSLVDEQFYSIILYAGAASGDKTFTHTQTASSTSWTVNHPLNKKPSVTITTLATGVQIIGEVSYTNNNTLVVSFAAAVSGIAHLN